MNARFWLNLGLLVAAGVLVVLVVFEPGKQAPPQPEILTDMLPEAANHILITRRNDAPIELQKTDGQWWMLKPWHLPANDFRVQSLLRLLEAESPGHHDLSQLDPAKYGLDKPVATVTFNHTLKIDFGNTAPLQQRRYLAVNNQLHTLFDTFYYQAASKPVTFLSHALLPPDAKPEKLVMPKLTLALQQGSWVVNPPQPRLSADAPIELVNQWRTAQALSIRPVIKPAGKADIEITLQGTAQPLRFKLQQTDESVTLTRMDLGLEYVMPADIMAQLLSLPEPPDAPEVDTEQTPATPIEK
ncbi:MAG: DUF4340 domain-containing protein [Proteobacteria bacterium]|jgi:hypothetical protein|nr:DUF4340 domain-containing protein [Pseudomonadota bacterium]